MPLPKLATFVDGVLQSKLLDADQCADMQSLQATVDDARALAQELLRREWLTAFQINQIFQGKGKDLTIGPFMLLERVGEGGMGQVFKAKHKVLQRVVALKVIRKECLNNKKVIQRFKREIRAAGQLSHPHIVRAYDADQVNGAYYIAMEYIVGMDLARLVQEEGPLKMERACEYIRQAALGLQHAFERGLVHRDIKPANLLVTRAVNADRRRSSGAAKRPPLLDERKENRPPRPEAAQAYPFGVIKILDMGLARCTDSYFGRASTHLTQVGSVMGTPEYIAPEQARDSHNCDVRADLYSLGCTLYFLLTGQPPFPNGTLTEKLLQHQFDPPPPIAFKRRERLLAWQSAQGPVNADEAALCVPMPVAELINKLLAKNPDERFQTPIELANALQPIVHDLGNGKLLAQEIASRTATFPVIKTSPPKPKAEEATRIVTPAPRPARSIVGKLAVVAAAGAGLVVMLVATVIAVLVSRGNLTQASVVPVGPPGKVKESDAPTWKRLVKAAIAQNASFEEARQELYRQRVATSDAAQIKTFDDLLTKIPSPFDELDHAKFEGSRPVSLPEEVIGVYGFAKGNAGRPVTALAVNPTGRWLATNEDHGVRLFDMQGSLIPFKILGHKDRVTRVLISPDGRLLASASDDGSVRIWDLLTRNRLFLFDKHQRPVTQIAFNHDGALIASAGRDGAVRLWDPRSGAEIRKIDTSLGDVSTLAFTPDGKTLFWSGATNVLCWAEVKGATVTPVGRFDLKVNGPRFLVFQPRGNLAIAGNGQGAFAVYTWDGKTLTEKATLREHQQIHHVAFASDGKSFVSAGSEPCATLWDADSLRGIKSWKNPRAVAHSAAFAPDNRHLVLGAANSQVYVIRLAGHDRDALKKVVE